MQEVIKSDKKYAIAVILSGIFGVLGIHHFYCGRIAHGAFDLALAIVGIGLMQSDDLTLFMIGLGLFIVDVIHTVVVTYILLVGNYKDGQGKLITYPGQKI
jgi:TM2 domain-containing membrane protein YozV